MGLSKEFYLLVCVLSISEYLHSAEFNPLIDMQVKNLTTNSVEQINKGIPYKNNSNDPLLFEQPGYYSILVLPVKSSSQVEMSLNPVDRNPASVLSPEQKRVIDQATSEIVLAVFEIQTLISQNKISEAREKLNILRGSHSGVYALDYLSASISILEKKPDEAKTTLQKLVEKYPLFVEAKKFLDQLNAR